MSRHTIRTLSVSTVLGLLASLVVAGPAVAAAPSNDEVEGAKPVAAMPFTDTIDVTDATSAPSDPSECNSGKSVWYVFTPEIGERVVATTFGSDYDTTLAIFDGQPANNTRIGCNGDWRSPQSRASFDAKPGKTYYFMVSGIGGVLQFNLEVAVLPVNDSIADAIRIPSKLPWTYQADTTEATLDLNDPSCSGKARSVWFRYTRPAKSGERRIEMNTFRSNYDTTLSVYSGRPGNLEQLKCDDNSGGQQSKLRFKAQPGKTYWVMIGSARNQPAGNLTFKVKEAPIPFRLSFSASSRGVVSSVTGAATISGTVTCSRRTTVVVYVSLRQKVGDRVVSGSTRKSISCKDKRSWNLNVASSRPFKPGDAGLYLRVVASKYSRDRSSKRIVTLSSCGRCL